MQEHIIQITFAYPAGEITIVNITHLVIRQTFIFQATGYFIICSQIILLYVRIEISRIILIPSPVTGYIELRKQIRMSVLQFRQHFTQYIK